MVLNIFSSKFKYNFFYIKQKEIILSKNSIYIFCGKKKFINFMFFYFSLFFKKIKFKRNFFLCFKFKDKIIGHNIFPDWPGNYNKDYFYINLFMWLKYLFYFVIHKRKLIFLLVKVFK